MAASDYKGAFLTHYLDGRKVGNVVPFPQRAA